MKLIVLRALADAIDAARAEHRQWFPHENYRAANIALGGLRRVAAAVAPETFGLGNDECVRELRAIISKAEKQSEA